MKDIIFINGTEYRLEKRPGGKLKSSDLPYIKSFFVIDDGITYSLLKGSGVVQGMIYEKEEKLLILTTIFGLLNHHNYVFDLLEPLVFASGDKEVIDSYKLVFANDRLVELQNIVERKIKNEEIVPLDKESHYFKPSIAKDPTEYTIIDLVEDLIEDKSYILVDSDLLGRYNRVSKEVKDKSDIVAIEFDRWNRICGKVMNKSRANLSISYSVPVSVDVPENTFNVIPGRRELTSMRSYCIVLDGSLWSTKLAVKVNSPELKEKLKNLDATIFNIIYDNEFLIDLTKMSLCSSKIISNDLIEKNLEYHYLKISKIYYDLLFLKEKYNLLVLPEKQDKPKKTQEEIFLESLGIYRTNYIPKKTKTIHKNSYNALSLEINSNYKFHNDIDIRKHCVSYINTGCSSSVIIHEYLDRLPKDSIEKRRDESIQKLKILKDTILLKTFHRLVKKESLSNTQITMYRTTWKLGSKISVKKIDA